MFCSNITRYQMLNTLLFMTVLTTAVYGSSISPFPQVNPPVGPIIGKYSNSKIRGGRTIAAFEGIPYAKPPIGSLRFKPPQPVDSWTTPLLAVEHSPRCIQPVFKPSSEDCLYLNIYTPINYSNLLPVLVYFYGGTYDNGGTEDYGPEYIMEEADIIYIVLNFRGTLFGWLSFGDEVVPGNMGLKDCRLALQWIQTNILSFGGDPEKVTIWGLSSGAVIVHSFMLYAADQGLFRAGITNSGTCLTGFGFKSPAAVTKMKHSIAKSANCPTESNQLLECLQAKSAEEVLFIYEVLYHISPKTKGWYQFVGPVMEPDCIADRFVTMNPWNANVTVPWLGGVSSGEAQFLFIPAVTDPTGLAFFLLDCIFDNVAPLLMNYHNSAANGSTLTQLMREFYLRNQPISRATFQNTTDMVTDAYFVYGVHEAVQRSNTSQMYFYLIDYKGTHQMLYMPPSGRLGSTHGDDLLFFFPHPSMPVEYPRLDTEEDVRMSRTLIRMWTNFAIYLDPTPDNSSGLQWSPYSNNQSYLHFKQDDMTMEHNLWPERMQFWRSVPYPNRDDGDYRDVPCNGYELDLFLNHEFED